MCIMFCEGLPFTKQMFYYDAVGRLVVVDASVYGSCYRLAIPCARHAVDKNAVSTLSSASEVTTLWRYTNLFIIIIIITTQPGNRTNAVSMNKVHCTLLNSHDVCCMLWYAL